MTFSDQLIAVTREVSWRSNSNVSPEVAIVDPLFGENTPQTSTTGRS
jgi:hypothetical protein